ncbi:glycosyltransferase family 2 protein [Dentipellis sp. KUC8613]|nr:glycosyltransferase family 2 protein [Dentipellis sp. KUC8613]
MDVDSTTVLYGGALLLAATAILGYTLLLLWTPPPIPEHASERSFLSPMAPTTPKPLPRLADPATLDLTVVVPAYNETKRLPSMLTTALKHLASTAASKKRTYEVLIVDDGSSDGTADAALKLAAKHKGAEIRVVKLEKNLGKGGAVRHGMLHGRGRRLLFVDADGASRFEDLEGLWDALDVLAPGDGDEVPGVAVGSRAHLVHSEAVVKRSFIRNFLMYGLHTVLRIVGVGHIRDTQCGFKLFTRAAARAIFPQQHLATWIFDVELLLLAKQSRIPVAEVPVEWHEVPGSKLNVMLDSLQMLRDLLVLRANMMLGRWRVGQAARAKTD